MKRAWVIIDNQAAACRLQEEAWKHSESKKTVILQVLIIFFYSGAADI
jgi:hypothetical protein